MDAITLLWSGWRIKFLHLAVLLPNPKNKTAMPRSSFPVNPQCAAPILRHQNSMQGSLDLGRELSPPSSNADVDEAYHVFQKIIAALKDLKQSIDFRGDSLDPAKFLEAFVEFAPEPLSKAIILRKFLCHTFGIPRPEGTGTPNLKSILEFGKGPTDSRSGRIAFEDFIRRPAAYSDIMNRASKFADYIVKALFAPCQ